MTISPPSPPTQAQLADPKIAKIWKAAQDFEAMTIGSLLKPIFETVDLSKGPFGGGDGEATFSPMLIDEMGKSIAASGGFGLAAPVFEQMLRTQEASAGRQR